MSPRAAFIAANRFGFGPAPGDLAAIAGDPQGWVQRQLDAHDGRPPPELAALPPGAEIGAEISAELAATRMAMRTRQPGGEIDETARRRQRRMQIRDQIARFGAESAARFAAAVNSGAPLIERLTHFWSNHFTISVSNRRLLPIAGAYEREAIRPHILGRFESLLGAALRHPAMLIYLDQAQSVGPNSPAGRRRDRGLNENLAREILELHTLGVDGGYGQGDVEALARILTGWTLDRRDLSFAFRPALHEPGPKILLGRRYGGGGRGAGEAEGQAALADLAAHPATARFLATKLARHFIADEPPERAVTTLAEIYLSSGGDLGAMTRRLIELPESWADPLAKVKSPQGWLISAARATGLSLSPRELDRNLSELGQPPFRARSPAGWPDIADGWLAPEALTKRIEIADHIAARTAPLLPRPDRLARELIGPVANPDILAWIGRAESRRQGLAMLLASAEFQRR